MRHHCLPGRAIRQWCHHFQRLYVCLEASHIHTHTGGEGASKQQQTPGVNIRRLPAPYTAPLWRQARGRPEAVAATRWMGRCGSSPMSDAPLACACAGRARHAGGRPAEAAGAAESGGFLAPLNPYRPKTLPPPIKRMLLFAAMIKLKHHADDKCTQREDPSNIYPMPASSNGFKSNTMVCTPFLMYRRVPSSALWPHVIAPKFCFKSHLTLLVLQPRLPACWERTLISAWSTGSLLVFGVLDLLNPKLKNRYRCIKL